MSDQEPPQYSFASVSRQPGAIPEASTILKLWGDETSGQVSDTIYVSNERIHEMLFTLPPGGWFRHSENSRTLFGADELYYIVSGTLIMANPATGEVHRAEQGEAVFFGPDVWHHGFNGGRGELCVLEYFAPPPSTGTSQAYARTKPLLAASSYVQDQWLGCWPEAIPEARKGDTQRLITHRDILWRIEGEKDPLLVGILLSTPRLTVACVELLPGRCSDLRVLGGDAAGYVLEGEASLFLPRLQAKERNGGWFRMKERDGFLVPEGEPHRYFNMTGRTTRFLFGVAPSYLPAGAPGAEN